MKYVSKRQVVIVLFTMISCGCSDPSDVRRMSTGHIEMSGDFVFAKTPPGGQETRRVKIDNVSQTSVILADFEQKSDDALNASWSLIGANGKALEKADGSLPESIKLRTGESLRLSLTFRPKSAREPSGSINFRSNSGLENQRSISIPITGAAAVGELHISPNELNFGRVAVGTSQSSLITLTNLGTHQVNVADAQIQGSAEFTVEVKDQHVGTIGDGRNSSWPTLAPGEQVQFSVEFSPETDRAVNAELLVTSDAYDGKHAIGLVANAAAPCARISPDNISFPPTAIGAERRVPIRIESCGMEGVTLQDLSLVSGSDVFEVVGLPDFPHTLAGRSARASSAPGVDALAIFKPRMVDVKNGRAVMTSTDVDTPEDQLELVGRGVDNECPVPVIAQAHFEGRPLDVISLDASGSRDPDGPQRRPVTYAWVIVQRPEGSTSQPVESHYDAFEPALGGSADRLETPRAEFFMDLAGEYVFELQVTDHYGAMAPSELCPGESVRLRARAIPDDTLHIQLTWDTPADEDQTDDLGTDIDLHLLHPSTDQWDTHQSLSCNYTNRNPDWGRPGQMHDDPSLDIDDVNGAGPENININQPEDTSSFSHGYRIGAHYFSASLGGTQDALEDTDSVVTIRVFLDGSLAHESRKTLHSRDELWSVGDVHFDGRGGRFRGDDTVIRMQH